MTKAILIDDEPLARSILKEYLASHPDISVVQECSDGFEGIKAIMQHQPDLVFLDIQMPKINGFEMLELIDQPPSVIFTTAFDEYAIRAFETHAVDYLLKPFSQERFDRAIERWKTQVPQLQLHTRELLNSGTDIPTQSERVVVKTAGKIRIIPVTDILFVEAADDYVKLHTGEGAFLKNKTLSFFENCLDSQQFVRVHRSYILNISAITRIDPYEKEGHMAVLKNGVQVPVSRNGYSRLRDVLGL